MEKLLSPTQQPTAPRPLIDTALLRTDLFREQWCHHMVSQLGFCCCICTTTKSNLWGEGLFQLTSWREVKAGKEPRGKGTMKDCCSRACPSMLAQFAFCTPWDQSGMAPPIVGCTLPHQSPIKTMFCIIAYKLNWWGHFLSWSSCFSDDSSLYQVIKNKKIWVGDLAQW